MQEQQKGNIKKNWPKEVWTYSKISLLIAAVIYVSFNHIFLWSWEFFEAWEEFVYSFLISMALSLGISKIIDFTDNHISWIQAPVKRLFTELTTVIVYAFLISIIFSVFSLVLLNPNYNFTNLPWDNILRNSKFPIYISLFMTAILTSRAFLFEWRSAAIATEKLRGDRFQGQYQSLKNQLNPHFLFNSLNTLSNLVYADQEKAITFIQKLSKIYRYVLEVQKEELVSLKQELTFLESYLGLQKLRFNENLQIEINVPQQEKLLPPLSLQLLIENAIKHNVVSADDPLKISIVQLDNFITVTNNLQPKDISEDSTGIGLNNIKSRLAFFTDEELSVSKNEHEFIVSLPLLDA